MQDSSFQLITSKFARATHVSDYHHIILEITVIFTCLTTNNNVQLKRKPNHMDAKKQDIQTNPTGTSLFKLHFFRSPRPLIALLRLLSGMPVMNIQATDADFKRKLAMTLAIFSDLNMHAWKRLCILNMSTCMHTTHFINPTMFITHKMYENTI